MCCRCFIFIFLFIVLLFDIYNLNGQGLSPLQTFVRWSISPCTCCRMWQQKSCSLLSMDHEQFVCYQPMVPFLMLHYDNNHHQVERLHMRYWQYWPYDNNGRGSFELSHLNMSSWIRMATKRLKTVIRYCIDIYILHFFICWDKVDRMGTIYWTLIPRGGNNKKF